MALSKTRKAFLSSEEGKDVKKKLQLIDGDSLYNTLSSYSTNSLLYPDNLIPFVDKHMNYLISHPQLDTAKYLANIRLMSRVR